MSGGLVSLLLLAIPTGRDISMYPEKVAIIIIIVTLIIIIIIITVIIIIITTLYPEKVAIIITVIIKTTQRKSKHLLCEKVSKLLKVSAKGCDKISDNPPGRL